MKNILPLILSFAIFSILFNYLVKYVIKNTKIALKVSKDNKAKIIWTIICFVIYIIGYVLIDFIGLGIIGFNIARGFLLAVFVTLLLFNSKNK